VQPVIIKADKVMVRVGGGYKTLKEHILDIVKFEALEIFKKMEKTGSSFEEVIIQELEAHKATTAIKNDFLRQGKKNATPFSQIVMSIKHREGRRMLKI